MEGFLSMEVIYRGNLKDLLSMDNLQMSPVDVEMTNLQEPHLISTEVLKKLLCPLNCYESSSLYGQLSKDFLQM